METGSYWLLLFHQPIQFPLNLAAHKIAPALAAGCPFVLKPASLTPIGAIIIGESCISVQRIIIHEKVYDEFKEKLVAKASVLKVGDPKDPETYIGPMISEKEATRLHSWIDEAVAEGATLLCGGSRQGSMLEATLLEGVKPSCKANTEEAFGPLANLASFSDFDEALNMVNASQFGLQAGIFARDLYKMQKA